MGIKDSKVQLARMVTKVIKALQEMMVIEVTKVPLVQQAQTATKVLPDQLGQVGSKEPPVELDSKDSKVLLA